MSQYLQQYNFKYENLHTLSKMFEHCFYFARFDLRSGYHHVSINPAHYKYLGFSWPYESGLVRYFVFLVLPFGLSPASYVFTKLLRPLISKWRGEGLRCVLYIDDGIFGSASKRITALAFLRIRSDLEDAGFTINDEKSTLYPIQVGTGLGFVVDTRTFRFSVPTSKVENVIKSITNTLLSSTTTARMIARIAVTIISMGPAIGPLTRFFTQNKYRFVDKSRAWDGHQSLDTALHKELVFWKNSLNKINGYAIKSKHAFTKIVYADASGHSYGGYIVQKLGNTIAQGTFTDGEKSQSSTYRELAAVKYILQSFKHDLKQQIVLWHSDNQNTAQIIHAGSANDRLHRVALDIYHLCLQADIQIISKWIPRGENTLADEISKFHDTDSWSIDNETFDFIQRQFGIFDIDRFASSSNNKVTRFDARFHCPNAETVNTFTAHWGGGGGFQLAMPSNIAHRRNTETR